MNGAETVHAFFGYCNGSMWLTLHAISVAEKRRARGSGKRWRFVSRMAVDLAAVAERGAQAVGCQVSGDGENTHLPRASISSSTVTTVVRETSTTYRLVGVSGLW